MFPILRKGYLNSSKCSKLSKKISLSTLCNPGTLENTFEERGTQKHKVTVKVRENVVIKKNEFLGIATIPISTRTILNGQLLHTISFLESWKEGKGLLLYSGCNFNLNGRFNSSFNLQNFKEMLHNVQELIDCIQRLPLVSVYLLNGKSSGFGTDLFLSTDFRLVTPKSEINFDHLKLGLPPLAGGTRLLQKLLGERETLRLLLQKVRLSSEEAVDLALADKILFQTPSWDSAAEDQEQVWKKHKSQDEEEAELRAENWLGDLLGRTNEDASIVQAVKRILVASRPHKTTKSDNREIILNSLLDQPHLTAMGLNSEPMFAHLKHNNDPVNVIMGGNAKDDFIA